jgi:hypothetical protein
VVQRNVKSSLLLLLVISAVFAFSILYSSSGLAVGTATSTGGEVLTQSPLHVVALDGSRRGAEHVEDRRDEVTYPGDCNLSPEQSGPAEISLPSANSSSSAAAVPPKAAHEQNAGPSKRIAHSNIQCPCVHVAKLYVREACTLADFQI